MITECSTGNIPPGYKQTEVGVIPEDWEVKPVGEAFEVHNHLRVPISQKEREKIAGKYPYYGPTGIQGYINEYRIEGQYALIGEDGDHFLKWREMPMTLMVSGKFNVNNHAHVVKGTNNLTAWFYYYFSHKDLTQHLTRQGAGRYKLTKKTLLNIQCVLPSPPEQKAITEVLSDTDAFIESLEQLIAKKRQIKHGAMQELLTGKRRLPGFGQGKGYKQTEVGVIPKDWDVRSAGEICKVNQGLQIAISNRLKIPSPNSKKYITIQYLNEGKEAEYIDSYSQAVCCNRNDVLMTRTGNTGILITNVDGVFHNNFFKINYDKKLITKEHLVNFLRLEQTQKQILIKAGTSTIPDLNHSDFYSIYIVIPPLAEQETISAILSDMDSEITALEEKLSKARQLKQGMMQELLTGRIRLI